MRQYNPNVPPPNGHVFRDIDGTKIKGTSWSDVERKLLVYRRQTGGKTDNLLEEIIDQVCASTPHYCKEPRTGPPEPARSDNPIRHIVIASAGGLAREVQEGKAKPANAREVEVRVKTCAGCLFRKHADIGCERCESSLAALRKVALGDKDPIAPALGICSLLEEDLPTSVHLGRTPVQRADLPDHCWRKAK